MQSLSDCTISRVEFCSPRIGINSIPDLVVATLIEAAEIEPDLRDIGVDADSP